MHLLSAHQLSVVPEPDLRQPRLWIGDHPQIDRFVRIDAGHLALDAVDGYLGRRLWFACLLGQKRLLWIRKGEGKLKWAKEALALFYGPLKAHTRDLSGGAVDLAFIVALHLASEYLPYLCDGCYVLPRTGPYDPILQPSVGPLDFPFGLRRERVDHLHPQFLQYLFPLRVFLVRSRIVLRPYRIPLLEKAEHGMIVDIIGKGQSVAGANAFKGHDVRPA